jgi:hypothetical protein
MTTCHLFQSTVAAAAFCLLSISSARSEKPGVDKAVPAVGQPAAPEGKELLTEVRFPDAKSLRPFAFSDPAAWRWGFSDKDGRYLELFQKSKYKTEVRSPFNIALLKDAQFGSVVMDFEVRQTGKEYGHRDLCFFFGVQDRSHYYYVHIASVSDPHSHNIMIVDGAPRKSISESATDGHDWSAHEWHHIRVSRDIESGKIEIFANDMATPIMTATDKTFGAGWAGFGSFDDTGRVRAIRVYGEADAKTDEALEFFKSQGE